MCHSDKNMQKMEKKQRTLAKRTICSYSLRDTSVRYAQTQKSAPSSSNKHANGHTYLRPHHLCNLCNLPRLLSNAPAAFAASVSTSIISSAPHLHRHHLPISIFHRNPILQTLPPHQMGVRGALTCHSHSHSIPRMNKQYPTPTPTPNPAPAPAPQPDPSTLLIPPVVLVAPSTSTKPTPPPPSVHLPPSSEPSPVPSPASPSSSSSSPPSPSASSALFWKHFRSEFHIYPFPPPHHRLCQPLLPLSSPTRFHSAHSTPAPRKRLLARWRRDSCVSPSSSLPSSPSLPSASRLVLDHDHHPSTPLSPTRKRPRPGPHTSFTLPISTPAPALHSISRRTTSAVVTARDHSYMDADYQHAKNIVHSAPPAMSHARSPVMSHQRSPRALLANEYNSSLRGKAPHTNQKRNANANHNIVIYELEEEEGESENEDGKIYHTRHKANHNQAGVTTRYANSIRHIDRRCSQGGLARIQSGTIHASNGHDSAKSRTLPDRILHRLKLHILELRDQRTQLERQELEEIGQLASTTTPTLRPTSRSSQPTVSGTNATTCASRRALKSDIEQLCSRAIRDMLRLLSDRMRGRGFVAGKVWDEERCDEDTEVRLPLDALPSEVIRELQVIVQREKGLVVIKASLRLDAVRGLLKEAVAEYREMMKDAWT